MPNFFLSYWWPGVLLWAVLYVLDYTMTVVCARLYRRGACEKFAFEGSYELNPIFQNDIDKLRTLSPRFVALLVIFGVLLTTVWWTATTLGDAWFYFFLLGAMVGTQMAVHVRHFHNYVLFRYLATNEGMKGRIEYKRELILRTSAFDMLAFGVMFGILAGLTLSWFLAGGAASCLSLGWKHFGLARKQVTAGMQGQQTVTATTASNP